MPCNNTLGECCGNGIPNCPGWVFGDEIYHLSINPSLGISIDRTPLIQNPAPYYWTELDSDGANIDPSDPFEFCNGWAINVIANACRFSIDQNGHPGGVVGEICGRGCPPNSPGVGPSGLAIIIQCFRPLGLPFTCFDNAPSFLGIEWDFRGICDGRWREIRATIRSAIQLP